MDQNYVSLIPSTECLEQGCDQHSLTPQSSCPFRRRGSPQAAATPSVSLEHLLLAAAGEVVARLGRRLQAGLRGGPAMATWEGELEKQILSGAFISSFASHPALKMNRCQEKASHPQGKSKGKVMNTSSTQSFLLFYIKQNLCVCVCMCISIFDVPSF